MVLYVLIILNSHDTDRFDAFCVTACTSDSPCHTLTWVLHWPGEEVCRVGAGGSEGGRVEGRGREAEGGAGEGRSRLCHRVVEEAASFLRSPLQW